MKSVFAWFVVASALTVCGERVVEEPSGYDLWGMRPKHVAVVNPVLGEDPRWVKSLAGEWEFCARKFMPERRASWGVMFAHKEKWPDTRKMKVPGMVEVEGVGEPGMSRPWDCFWDQAPKPLRHVFHGAGWYRREVEIPSDWAGRRIWFKVGEVASQGWLWVNGTQVAWLESYCGSYKYEITDLVKPGEKAKIVLQVSNEVANRCGCLNEEETWLGVLRDLELESTPAVFIDEAWVRGDFDAKVAEVHVDVVGESGELKLKVEVEGETKVEKFHCQPQPSTSTCSIRLPLRDFRPWSPEHPNLYTAKIDLVYSDQVIQTRRERFGVRKLEVRGKEFYLNNRPFFVRGIGFHNMQPIYGPSRMCDREYRRFEVKRMRDAGFNFLRTHTRCETPEFFEVCDELGMLVQPELPYYNDQPCEKFEFNPVRDAKELYIHRRRHPSFAVYSHGNEGSFGPALGNHMYKFLKSIDPDRLVIEQDGGSFNYWAREISSKFNPKERADFVGGPIKEWPRGSAVSDRPIVAHEYLNLAVKANADLEDRYTGIWQTPLTRKMRTEFLTKCGLTEEWGRRLQLAQHALQAEGIKKGIEWARLDPECDGYDYWSAQDCTTKMDVKGGTIYTAQGLFDPFWGDKPNGLTAAAVARFNSPTGVFCDTFPSNRIAVAGERVRNVIFFANYGDAPLANARLVWRLVNKKNGRVLLSGERQVGDQALGAIREVASVDFTVPSLSSAVAARFEVELGDAKNDWTFWLFPKRAKSSLPDVCIASHLLKDLGSRYADLVPPAEIAKAKIVIAKARSAEAMAALDRGQRVIALNGCDGKPNVSLGWWWIGTQVGTVFREHAVFARLPHEGILNGLFSRIVKTGRALPVAGLDPADLMAVGEGAETCYIYLAQAKSGKGRVLSAEGLDVLSDTTEGIALLDGMIDYARSAAFEPKSRVDKFIAPSVSENIAIDFSGERRALRPSLFGAGLGGQLMGSSAAHLDLIKDLHLTAARTHDWALCNPGQRILDTHFVFPILHADASDPKNYYFEPSDTILSQSIDDLGLKILYRMGTSIEPIGARSADGKRAGYFNVVEPLDWDQYAKALAGIIRHYTQGWAHGRQWKDRIRYWELWNEPNEFPSNSWIVREKNPDWNLNRERFYAFFVHVLSRLKKEFPDLKFGGPALSYADFKFLRGLLKACKEKGYEPDFISWHGYDSDPDHFFETPPQMRAICDQFGFRQTELVVNEWHYIPSTKIWSELGASPEKDRPYYDKANGLGGIDSGVFMLQMFAAAQSSILDQFYFYGCGHDWANWGIRHHDGTLNKTYYALKFFGTMMADGDTFVKSEDRPHAPVRAFGVLSKDAHKAYLMVTSYRGSGKAFSVAVRGLEKAQIASVRVLDLSHDFTPGELKDFLWRDGRLTFSKPESGTCAYLVEFAR